MINCISKANNLLYRTSRKIWFRRERNWLVIHAFYLDIWDATRDHVLEDQHLMIDIDIYMRWYMYITCCFITPIWSCFRGVHQSNALYAPISKIESIGI